MRTASEEIELKCQADATMQLLIGPRLKRYEPKQEDCNRHKSISSGPNVLTNKLIKEAAVVVAAEAAAAAAAQLNSSNFLPLTSAIEVGQDALSLIKFTRFDFEPGKKNLNSLQNKTCSADQHSNEQVVANESLENGARFSILELSLDSEAEAEAEAEEDDQDDYNDINDQNNPTKWAIKESEELSISSLEVNLGTMRAEFSRRTLCESVLDNKSHVNIATSKCGIVVSSGPSSSSSSSLAQDLAKLEKVEVERESNITSLVGYEQKRHKSSCKQSREKNRSLKATFTRNGRHFSHWLMATCSYTKQTFPLLPSLFSSSRQQQQQHNSRNNFMVMISYCHKEAQQYALSLKESLEQMGLSVYLDVDEIWKGCDWQDSLNEAIYKCHAFVPLVTSSYGETLWTRRELKLADALNKHIIPINFCPSWPPAKLAIQFVTVQYISWLDKSDVHYNFCEGDDDDDDENGNDYGNDYGKEEVQVATIPRWSRACVRGVAHQIRQSIRQRLGYISELPIQGEEFPVASSSSEESADSMYNSSSYTCSPELEETQHDNNNNNNNNRFSWFIRKEKVRSDGDDYVQTSGEAEYTNSIGESMWQNTPPGLELNEEEPFQKQMQISCRSFSMLPRAMAASQIDTPEREREREPESTPTPIQLQQPLPARIVETETTTTTTTTTATATITKKKSLRFKAFKTFNKVRRRLNGHQEVTRG